MVQQLKNLSEQEQAVYFHARQRRRSLAGIPELHRTHYIAGSAMAVATINNAQFPAADHTRTVTFKTAIRILAGTGGGLDEHRGLVFELGSSAIGVALWLDDTTISFRAGENGSVNGAVAELDNTVELPTGLELELVAAVRPGDGRVRLWANGQEVARATASSNTFGAAGTWMAASDGSFAAAVSGTTPADVTQTGAPSGFEVIEPLSVYLGQVPRHFV